MKKDKDNTGGAARSTVNMEYITQREKLTYDRQIISKNFKNIGMHGTCTNIA